MQTLTTCETLSELVDQDDQERAKQPITRRRRPATAELPERINPSTRLNPRQAATFLGGVSERQVLRWFAMRELAGERLSERCIRFKVADLEAFANKRRQAVARSAQ